MFDIVYHFSRSRFHKRDHHVLPMDLEELERHHMIDGIFHEISHHQHRHRHCDANRGEQGLDRSSLEVPQDHSHDLRKIAPQTK